MNMNRRKDYIQFASDNWFMNWKSFSIYWDWWADFSISFWYTKNYTFIETKWYHLTEMITSKEFIEAIIDWLLKYIDVNSDKIYNFWILWEWMFTHKKDRQHFTDYFTKTQAIAIRDKKLGEFINTILWLNTK